jgi:glycerophosphoryl diester phosphodiesterase
MKKFLLILSLAAICVCCSSPAGQRPKVLAHRGLCTTGTEFTTDENTLDALIRAQEKGCEGV